jgi:hypothetical protein
MDPKLQLSDCVNRVDFDYLESNIVYPLDKKNIILICQVDPIWMKHQLRMISRTLIGIKNKYVITINKRFYYQHDGIIWLIEEVKPNERAA